MTLRGLYAGWPAIRQLTLMARADRRRYGRAYGGALTLIDIDILMEGFIGC